MELIKHVLFAAHTTTGSIYQTHRLSLGNAKSVRFFCDGPINAGVGASCTVWFECAGSADDAFENYYGAVVHSLTVGSGAATSSTNTFNIASSVSGSMKMGYLRPEFMPEAFRVKYEISGVTASAGAGTMRMILLEEREVD